MQGRITELELLEDSEFIIDSFGLDFWALCVSEAYKGASITFLGMLMKYNRI